jgi:hypothetical protein
MQLLSSLQSLFADPSVSARVALLAIAWTAASTLAHFFTAVGLYVRFSRAGPVLPLLLPQLTAKWERAVFGLAIWVWIRRIGLALLFVAVLLATAELGLQLRSLMAAGPSGPDWRMTLAEQLDRVVATIAVLGIGIFVRVVVGGFANIVAVRGQNFVTASNSLVSREEVDRVRSFLDRVEDDGGGTLEPPVK